MKFSQIQHTLTSNVGINRNGIDVGGSSTMRCCMLFTKDQTDENILDFLLAHQIRPKATNWSRACFFGSRINNIK